jgi:hypothetical protein
MAKITNPIRFSEQFGVEPEALLAMGALNPNLSADTPLFIDPMLLEHSKHIEICPGGREAYRSHFTKVIEFLNASKSVDDVAWRSAKRLLLFPEVKGICLGYGAQSVSGSGSGTYMTDRIIDTAKQIVDLGIEDPDLFSAMALFEEGFGPDAISDMTANVILESLLKFNDRVFETINVQRTMCTLRLRSGESVNAELPINPFVAGGAPIILVPTDILDDLPVARDWDGVASAASRNAEIRGRVNAEIAKLWKLRTLRNQRDKDEIRRWALESRANFHTFLEMVRGGVRGPYDSSGDPEGLLTWMEVAANLLKSGVRRISAPKRLDLDGVNHVVEQIIEEFRFLIEERRFSEHLYHHDSKRRKKFAQMLFFGIADSYCKANNLDLTPEAETGNGPVDFKVSQGFGERVLVETKLSTNTKLVKGYTRQLEAYKAGEQTVKAHYVVLNVGGMGKKDERLIEAKNQAALAGQATSPIIIIDGIRRPSASKL